jgi:hypothetical protein
VVLARFGFRILDPSINSLTFLRCKIYSLDLSPEVLGELVAEYLRADISELSSALQDKMAAQTADALANLKGEPFLLFTNPRHEN